MKYTSLLEKFGLALLIFAWLVYGSNFLGNTLVYADKGDVEALRIAGAESDGTMAEDTEVAVVDFDALMAVADPGAGEKAFKKCVSCHTVAEGGKNKVGPNLWSIVGRTKASTAGFAYSDVLAGLGGSWTVEDLNLFLESPKKYAPGNKMTFKGISDPAKRAGLIAYLSAQGN